jgi:hypothetical protein
MAYSFRRRAIAIAKEAYLLHSRRGLKVPGFFTVDCEDGADSYYVWAGEINQPIHGMERWIVELKLNGATQCAYNDKE